MIVEFCNCETAQNESLKYMKLECNRLKASLRAALRLMQQMKYATARKLLEKSLE